MAMRDYILLTVFFSLIFFQNFNEALELSNLAALKLSELQALSLINLADTVTQSSDTDTTDSDLDLNTTEVITKYGYTAEEYEVTTEDGYILILSRIKNSGPVVFLMHGILNSADDWLSMGADALAFVLADAGYDVFLGNARGNKYCRNHTSLTTEQQAFWNFSFHEIGVYDVTKMIDYALQVSNTSKLTYIGHSQGTTVFFAMASLKPEYNDKINVMISLATVAWLYQAKSPVLKALAPFAQELTDVLYSVETYDLLAYDAFWKFITTIFCPSSELALTTCMSMIYTIAGFDYGQLDYTRLPTELGRMPEGISVKQLLHFGQLIQSKDFRLFDFNSEDANLEAYGTEVPPSYPVENITTPIAIMNGYNDWVSSTEDVNILVNKLPNVIDFYNIPYVLWNHLDYLWAKDAKDLVYDRILTLVKNQE